MKRICPKIAIVFFAIAFPVRAQLDSGVQQPYPVQLVVHFADHRVLTPLFREQVQRDLRQQIHGQLGSLAKVELTTLPQLRDIQSRGLQTVLDGWDWVDGRQWQFVLVDYQAGRYEMQTRWYDGFTGIPGPAVLRASVTDRVQVATEAARLVLGHFPVIGTVRKKGADLQLEIHGAHLPGLEKWIKPGSVFAVARLTAEGKNIRGQRISWACLEASSPLRKEGCSVRWWNRFQGDDLEPIPGILGYRAVLLPTIHAPVRVRFHDPSSAKPLEGLQIQIASTNQSKKVDATTDRDGLVETRETWDHLALVRVMSGTQVKAQIPVPLLNDRPVSCPFQLAPEAEQYASWDRRRDQWLRRLYDNLRLANDRWSELQTLLVQSLAKAHAAALEHQKTAQAEIDFLLGEQDQLTRLAKEKKIGPIDLREGTQILDALRDQVQQMKQFAQRQEQVLKDSTQDQGLAQMFEGAKLFETQAEFGKALALYQKIIASSPDQKQVRQRLDQLRQEWEPKSEAHAQARAYFFTTWAFVEIDQLGESLAQARESWEICKKAEDRLTPLKIVLANQRHAAQLVKKLDSLKRLDNEDNRNQAQALTKLVEAFRTFDREVKDWLKMRKGT